MRVRLDFWNLCLGIVLPLVTCASFSFALDTGEKAPNFKMAAGDGGLHELTSYQGKVIFLDFWAAWCGPCKESLPWMNEIYLKYSNRGLVVVAVNLDSDEAKANELLAQVKPQFKVLYDPEGKIAQMYDLKAMPSSFVIDRQGKIRLIQNGFELPEASKVEKVIESLLDGKDKEQESL